MLSSSAVFVGSGSLLIQCAETYSHAGHEIMAVMTDNPDIMEWATQKNIDTRPLDADAYSALAADTEFDYLFSVANLNILPPSLIARARKLSLNFHDAPLPRYAGLNATSWALIGQEKTHGVTWHEMTDAIDGGRFARQVLFDTAAGETALSLNARCYEAGLASFIAMVEDIGRGELSLTAQRGSRSYCGKAQRPKNLATLDFSRPAKELASLVSGLDFGQYPNPLARPKIYLGDKLLLVRTTQLPDTESSAPPGTLLKVDADGVLVATGEGDIWLAGLSDAMGRPAQHAFKAGQVLPALNAVLQEKLAQCTAQVAQGELFWRDALLTLAPPVELPYPRKLSQSGPGTGAPLQAFLDLPANGSQSVAAFFGWLSALTGQQRISAWYCDSVLLAQATGLEAWLSPSVPLTLASSPQALVHQVAKAAELQIAKARQSGPCTHDLHSRLGTKHLAGALPNKIGVSMHSTASLGKAELLLATDAAGTSLRLLADGAVFSEATFEAMATHLAAYIKGFESASARMADISLLPLAELEMTARLNATATPYDTAICVHEAVTAQAARTPDHTAISCQGQTHSYGELDQQATALALRLMQRGIQPGDIVGICLERTPDLVLSMLAVMKTGAAYLPLDPDYPQDRIVFMIEDSQTSTVLTSREIAATLALPPEKTFLIGEALQGEALNVSQLPVVAPESAAYVIFTSGSTGKPKGVVVTHRNVMNFFAGMAQRVPHSPPGRWLAVTSLSFDISVLELCWTLIQGATIVLHSSTPKSSSKALDFSLFYFGNDPSPTSADRYKLLFEGAKFADTHGFSAIWTPERHFHAFGGAYPNPALTSAALAAVTTRLKIRAGSCVLPLHHPVRVAEDWAFIDHISQGRVGVSFAAGWQPNDFAIAPEAFADRKAGMLANIDVVRRLWRGERVAFPGPLGKPVDIQTLPRPIQKEIPVWLTAAGNPETFQQAGAMGCHLLTHLLGQTLDDVAEKLRLYRIAWHQAGHPGQGHVTVMLHTFVGEDEDAVRETVRQPMKEYLRSSVDLIKQAAWTFPTFVQRGAAHGQSPIEIMDAKALSAEEMDALLEHAFARYYGTSALFGTPQRCLAMVHRLQEAGVDEIACLIDFGIETETVLAHLHDLQQLMEAAGRSRTAGPRASVAEEIVQNEVTHLQCTPSMASMLVADTAGRAALSRLSALMVGGEALPLKLARELRALVPGELLNMYGPTETTIWSTVCNLAEIGDFVPLGQPIANTQLHVRTPGGMECPALVAGELLIGGAGVSDGYWMRPELTAERFIADPAEPAARLYRTGDLVRRHPDGSLEFLGRIDHQVKIRGHRIELGEIESALLRQPGVKQAAAIVREDAADDKRLAAYVTLKAGGSFDAETVRRALTQELPEIMVPATVLVLQTFPLTPNGKVDRRAFPEPRSTVMASIPAFPESQLEKVIAAIWQQVLGLPSVGMSDNFFDLGGHSLLVVQVQRRLHKECGREVSITDMFRLPTIRALAGHLGGNAVSTAVGDGVNRANARRAMRARSAAFATSDARMKG